MSQARKPLTRTQKVVTWAVFAGLLVLGGFGFVDKFVQFIRTLHLEEGGGFTIIPISNYLLVAMGFFCLLAWGVANGMFHDIEKPKYTMLEREEELDRLDGREWRE